jgi:hypothetical protein
MTPNTVLLAVHPHERNDIPKGSLRRTSLRACDTMWGVCAPYDPNALSKRALAMLSAVPLGLSTFWGGDDLTSSFHRRYRSPTIEEAAELISADNVFRPHLRESARRWRRAYESNLDKNLLRVCEYAPPIAQRADLLNAADYLNKLAATAGLGVRPHFTAQVVWLDDVVFDTGPDVWAHMLRTGVPYGGFKDLETA